VTGERSERYVSLGGGVRAPYPEPSSAAATRIGKANRRVSTKCEVRVRSALHRMGLRFRKDLPLVLEGLRVRPDIVFTRAKVAVFVDGCFWHACPEHFHAPKSNLGYWEPKIRANVERDRRVSEGLRAAGWEVCRVWEHQDPADAAATVGRVVSERLRLLRSPKSSVRGGLR
jgi:DNA mismatch endonuclease (patch repair protein)